MSLFHTTDRKVGEKKTSEGQRERHAQTGYIRISAKPCCPPTGAGAASTLHPTPTASGMAEPNDPRREQPGKAATCFRLRLVNQLYQVACYCELIIAQSVTEQLKYNFMPALQVAAQCLGHSIFLLHWSYGVFLLLNPTCKLQSHFLTWLHGQIFLGLNISAKTQIWTYAACKV